jgi:c-di-GMP-binding flagellar brake protein YcgR
MELEHLRRYPRTKVDIPIDLVVDGAPYSAHAVILGGGGLFVRTAQPISSASDVSVRFRPAKHLSVVEARAKIRYQVPEEGIGIEFTDIDPEDRQKILRLILHRIGEKRKYPRRGFATQVEHAGGVLIGFSRDIGVGGMFVETSEPLPTGSLLRLRFHLDDGGTIVIATAEVMYTVTKLGMGVRFLELSPEDRNRIDVLVTKGESSA